MLTTPVSSRPVRSELAVTPPAGRRIEGRQRRAGAVLAVAFVVTLAGAVATGAGPLWPAAVAAIGAVYLLAVVRVRRRAARREMSAAFAADGGPDWDAFERGLATVALAPEVAGAEVLRPAVTGFDRELVAFIGAWALGLVLTPVVALIRLAGHDLGNPDRGGVLGTLVRLQAYGRSQSLKVVAAGLFATAGVTAVGAVAAGGTAYALPAHVTSTGLRTVTEGTVGWGSQFAPARSHQAVVAAAARRRHARSTRAAKAVSVALAQVGKPYSYGAAGPDDFDCSGLVMYSWAAAGVALPHNAAEQYDTTSHITESQLRPGDLVFYYGDPPGHVAMYIGKGQVVSANTTGTDVQTQSITYDGTPTGFSRVG